jgi:phage shock protein E
VLVDVRTPGEYTSGHIPTAINIPYDKIAASPPTPDKAALVIVYCASGHRAGLATKTLRGLGYTRVVDFEAIGRWKGQTQQGEDPGACPCQ